MLVIIYNNFIIKARKKQEKIYIDLYKSNYPPLLLEKI